MQPLVFYIQIRSAKETAPEVQEEKHMAFTRKYLAGLGIEAEKIESIMEAHVEVVEGLKSRIAETGDSADELARVKAELEQAKNDLKSAQDSISAAEKEEYKGKYESEKAAHEKLIADIAAEKTAKAQESALTKAAKAAKYSADAIASILDSKKDYAGRVTFDVDGKPTNMEEIMKAIAEDKPGLVPKAEEKRHEPSNPPADNGGKSTMTKADIMAIKDDAERQQAIKDNLAVFGLSEE